MSILTRGLSKLLSHGPRYIIQKAPQVLYKEFVRPYLPAIVVEYNGVAVAAHRKFDGYVPWESGPQDRPQYETGLCRALRETVSDGDTVVLVGGGWGISSVVAAEHAGNTGEVVTFEAGLEYVSRIRHTATLNNVSERVRVVPAIVGKSGSVVRGRDVASDVIHPAELPEANILVLDCEGAEGEIISSLNQSPRSIIVETHGVYGCSTSQMKELLSDRGYMITDERIAEEADGIRRRCIENDVYVLTTDYMPELTDGDSYR